MSEWLIESGIPVAWQSWHSGVLISTTHFQHDVDRWRKEGGGLVVVPLFYRSGEAKPTADDVERNVR